MSSTNYISGNPGNIQRAAEFVTSNFEHVSDETLSVLYADILYSETLPAGAIDSGMDEGVEVYSKKFTDKRGVGDWRAVGSNDIPQVGASLSKISVTPQNAAVGSTIDLQDIAQSQFSRSGGRYGLDIIAESNAAMMIASDRHIERTVWFGDAQYGYDGYINNPNIPQTTAALNAALTSTLWINKTPDEQIADIVTGLISVRTNTRTVFTPTTVYLPTEQFVNIGYTKAGTRANDETITNYLKRNGFVAEKYGELRFREIRYLAGAGVTGSDRMVIATELPSNYLMAMPIPFRVIQPHQFIFQQYLIGEYKYSGLKITQPIAFLYVDGI